MYLCFANTESRRRAEDNAFFRAVFRAGAIVSNRCVADAQQTEKMAFEIVETLFHGICVGVAASITVGPVAVLCIQRTLSKSRRSGIVSGIGVACADTFMAMAALFFYSMLQTQIEQYNTLLRVIGGIFVVIVGVFIFAQNPVPQIRRNRAGKTSLWQDFASIFGLTIANFIMVIPYILAFFAVFKISGGDMADHTFGGFMRSLFVIAGFFGGAVAWWTLLAFVINLFRRLQKQFNLTYVFISHDLGIIKYISDRIMIMYLGRVMEFYTSEGIYADPKHPYTQALLSAIPPESPFDKKERLPLTGDIPSPIGDQVGCPLAGRCPHCTERCKKEIPKLVDTGNGHMVACFLYE